MAKGNRRFTLTINDEEFVSRENIKEYVRDIILEKYHDVVYLAIGVEHAPTTGKLHLHVYIEFANQKSATQVSKLLANAHYEIYTDYDNGANAFAYLSKEDKTPLEYGRRKFTKVERTERCDNGYKGAVDAVLQGKDIVDILRTYPEIALRHYNALVSLYNQFCGRGVVQRDNDEDEAQFEKIEPSLVNTESI